MTHFAAELSQVKLMCNCKSMELSCLHASDIYCSQLLPRLQEVVQRREESGNPIDVKLKQVADELHSVVVAYLQVGDTCFPFAEGMYKDKCGTIHLKCGCI
jgi:hypothetical protein